MFIDLGTNAASRRSCSDFKASLTPPCPLILGAINKASICSPAAAALRHIERAESRRVRRGTHLSSPKVTRDYLSLKLGTLEREVFAVIFLDKRHRLISYQEMFQGTIDGASVHPREVVKEALKQNAAAVILAHPHPSGVAEPSQADELITNRLKDALGLIDVRILDHIIVAGGDTISFAERGLL
jgi:DNA repair protein RadC